MRFYYGLDDIGQDVVIDKHVANVMIIGSENKRTQCFLSIIDSCAYSLDTDYVLISESEELLSKAEAHKSFNKNYSIAFEGFFGEMERRYKMFSEQNCITIDDYNTHGGNLKHLLILVDELDVIRDRKNVLEKYAIPILQKGYAAGLHFVIGDRRKRNGYFSQAVKHNCQRIYEFE